MARSLSCLGLAIAGLFCGLGCGYQLSHGRAQLPEGIGQVAAPVFENRTAEPGAEVLFTNAFRRQLLQRRLLATSAGDAEVQGRVDQLSTGAPMVARPGAPGERVALPSYRIQAWLTVELRRGGRTLSMATVSASEEYASGADVLLTELNRQLAIQRLAEVLARDAVDALRSSW